MTPVFFPTPADFRRWFEENHAAAAELLVGFYKKDSGLPSITWPESVDQALCFGWIDGIRRSLDDISYTIRFTPRKPSSIWSAVNIRRVEELTAQGLMHPAGLAAFARRKHEKSQIYAYEQDHQAAQLPEADEQSLRANPLAWEFWLQQPASYRKSAAWWVISAKKEETHRKRLATLIEDCAQNRRLAMFSRPKK
ncbi:MAG: YdeI/OmpD-associated family protein [Anaerolineae bacterium]|nr:YdeI/OmpD-associated family protein [Anaerolineae bacterium]